VADRWAEGEENPMSRWPMKKERELIQLARANVGVEQIATRMKLAPASVLKAAKRLGLDLPPIAPKGGTLKPRESEGLEMGGRFKGSNLHHRRSDLRHLDGFAAAILLSPPAGRVG